MKARLWVLPSHAGESGRLTLLTGGDSVEAIVDGRAVIDARALDAVCLEYLEARGVLRPGWYTQSRTWWDHDSLALRRGWGGTHSTTALRAVDETDARRRLADNERHAQITQTRLLVRLEGPYRPVPDAVANPKHAPADQLDAPWQEDPNDRNP